jgi:hypothetical protein
MAKNYSIKFKHISGPLPKEVIAEATEYQLYEGNRRQRKAARYLLSEVKKASSVTTFSLRQLKNMGYPYATRHKKIKGISPLKPYNVHKRSGKFIKGFKISSRNVTKNKMGFARVNYDRRHAKYSKWIFSGTSRMLPRDPLSAVASSAQVQKNMRVILEGTRAASRGFKI